MIKTNTNNLKSLLLENNPSPLVSVIVPAYNEEDFIGDFLKSIVSQDFPKEYFEIIVVNNNCVDETANIAKKFGVKVVKETKQGLTYARIKGINEAKGKIIVFVDADCIANKECLWNIIKAYQDNDKVVGVGLNLDYQPKSFLIALCEGIINLSCRTFGIMPGGHFSFTKDAYNKCGGYSERIKFNEDIYISKKLRKQGKIIIQGKGLIITSSRRFRNFKEAFSHISKNLVSLVTISLFDFSFFRLKPVRK